MFIPVLFPITRHSLITRRVQHLDIPLPANSRYYDTFTIAPSVRTIMHSMYITAICFKSSASFKEHNVYSLVHTTWSSTRWIPNSIHFYKLFHSQPHSVHPSTIFPRYPNYMLQQSHIKHFYLKSVHNPNEWQFMLSLVHFGPFLADLLLYPVWYFSVFLSSFPSSRSPLPTLFFGHLTARKVCTYHWDS
jgi:hypothetical protein